MEQKVRRENGKGNGKESMSRNGYERERNGKEQKEKERPKKWNIICSKNTCRWKARNPTELKGTVKVNLGNIES